MPVRPLPPALAEKAWMEFNEDPQLLEKGIRNLKQWILNQPHLRARTDDQWLAAFLRGCKFRLDQAKIKIDHYFSLRSTAPYLYCIKYDDPKVTDILNLGTTLILQKTKNPTDPRVIVYRVGQYDPKQYSVMDVMSVLSLQTQICFMEDDNMTVSGTIHVVDLRGTRFAHYTSVTYRQLRSLVAAHEEAAPGRIKQIHYLNAPRIFGTVFSIIKRFMSKKIINRMMFHNTDLESFHKHVPKEILPEEYGGNGDSIQQCIDYWKSKMNDYSSFFEDDLKYGSDESKRLSKCQEVNEPLRRLDVD